MILLFKGVTVLLLTTFITCPIFSSDVGLTMSPKYKVDLTVENALDLLKKIQGRTAEQETVENYLDQVMNITSHVETNASDENGLISYGNGVLDATERKTGTKQSINISLQSVDVRVIKIEQNTSTEKNFSLNTSTASMTIELTEISNSTNDSVAIMSYTNMAAIMNRNFFNTFKNTKETMISAVVTATLLQTADTNFTSVTFTFTHEFYLHGFLFCASYPSCVLWETNEWVKNGSEVRKSNLPHTVCSCDHQDAFAVFMQTYPMQMNTWAIFTMAALGMICLSLSALTLAFCHPNTRATNMPLINLCISLLLAILYNLFKHNVWLYICPGKELSLVLSGIQLFLYLSAAIWMLIEAVHLFIFVKKLSKVGSNLGKWLSLKWLTVIGYILPLGLAIFCTVFHCTINYVPNGVIFIYYAPFCFIYASGMMLFIIIIAILIFNLILLKNGKLQRSNMNDKKLIISIMVKSIAQFFIIGGPWIYLIIPTSDMMENDVLLFFASQQGAFIFLVHCLLNQKVRKQYKKFLGTFCCFNNCNTLTIDGQVTQGTA